jgi:hypothetical protein
LEQDTSCPTCRKSLQDEKETHSNIRQTTSTNDTNATNNNSNIDNPVNAQDGQQTQQPQYVNYQRNLFHFDGSRYISWLPSFSLQVTNGGNVYLPLLRSNRNEIEPARLNEMTQQISQMFPHIPIESIQNDLRQTHSVELTIENILQERLTNSTSTNNNNISRHNLLNLNDYSDEEDDEDDDLSSSDDDNHNLLNDSTTNRNNNSEYLLRRRNIFS